MQFRLPYIDRISFWIGVAFATAFWWELAASGVALPDPHQYGIG